MALWLAVAVTLMASTGNSIGKTLQKQATKGLPRFAFESKVLWMYFRSTEWLVGVAADLLGGVLMVAAFAMAPVSIVQPVSGVGLVSLAVFSHFYLKERLQPLEWFAVGLAGLGTLGLGSEATTESVQGPGISLVRVVGVFGVMLSALGLLMLMTHRQVGAGADSSQRRTSATALGLQAGVCFGLSAASCRIGILLSENYFLFLPLGLSGSALLTSCGFVLQTRGLKDGNTVVVCTCAAVTAMVSGVAVGIFGLGESLPSTLTGKATRVASWGLIASGVAILAQGPGGAEVLTAMAASYLPRRLLGWLPPRLAVQLRQAAQRLELPVKATQAQRHGN